MEPRENYQDGAATTAAHATTTEGGEEVEEQERIRRCQSAIRELEVAVRWDCYKQEQVSFYRREMARLENKKYTASEKVRRILNEQVIGAKESARRVEAAKRELRSLMSLPELEV